MIWADSVKISWILSLGDEPRRDFKAMSGGNFGGEEEPAVGLWIETNKDTACLLQASRLSRAKTHKVVIAFDGCISTGGGRTWVSVWVDGVLCPEACRLHSEEALRNLSQGGRHASIRVEWKGGARSEVADLCVHAGELVSGVDPDEVLWVD